MLNGPHGSVVFRFHSMPYARAFAGANNLAVDTACQAMSMQHVVGQLGLDNLSYLILPAISALLGMGVVWSSVIKTMRYGSLNRLR